MFLIRHHSDIGGPIYNLPIKLCLPQLGLSYSGYLPMFNISSPKPTLSFIFIIPYTNTLNIHCEQNSYLIVNTGEVQIRYIIKINTINNFSTYFKFINMLYRLVYIIIWFQSKLVVLWPFQLIRTCFNKYI